MDYAKTLDAMFGDTDYHLTPDDVETIRNALIVCKMLISHNLIIVPIRPTDAMLNAACAVGPDTNAGCFDTTHAEDVWAAMIKGYESEAATKGTR